MKKYLFFIIILTYALILAGCSSPVDKSVNQDRSISKIRSESPQTPATVKDLTATKYAKVNDFPGVTMVINDGTVSATGLSVIFRNESSSECTYGEFYALEQQINGQWYEVPVKIEENYGFNDIGHRAAPGESRDWNVEWGWLYGTLTKGHYRIVKDILDFRGTGDYDTYYVSAEFDIP